MSRQERCGFEGILRMKTWFAIPLWQRVIGALILGIVETTVARLIDPGLTLAAAYAIFVLVLLFRPQGLFGRKPT